jgi:asparagine synthase (glutamine-hydrolysing)
MTDAPSYADVVLHGYSPWAPERILRAVDAGTRIFDLPGDFTMVASGSRRGKAYLKIVTSILAARPYYMAAPANGDLVHGSSVFDVVARARLPWRWNRRAISFLALLGHPVGEDTLHLDVRRVPAASVLTFEDGTLRIDSQEGDWNELAPPDARATDARTTTMEGAVAALVEVFSELAVPDAVLSLSAGFDSRLLLALALGRGHRPLALTMGFDDSTDVRVARQLAAHSGLEHRVVELDPEDYLAHTRDIVSCTSGTKTAAHWHTDLYVRKAGLPKTAVHYVGSNGEFARSFFFDWGVPARLLGAASPAVIGPYWAARLARRALRFSGDILALGPGVLACARHLAGLSSSPTLGASLDRFYATQRVRHFIGNGLALYAQHCAPRSPFLDARWIRAVSELARADRLGSNYHRFAIANLRPDLLGFSVAGGEVMARRAQPFYYLKRPRVVGYGAFDKVLANPRVAETIVEAEALDDLLPRAARVAAVASGDETVELLYTLAVAAELGRDAVRGARPKRDLQGPTLAGQATSG